MDDQQINDYLAAIDITGTLAERVHSVYAFYSEQLNLEVTDMFVSEYLTQDGTREFDSLWFFTEDFMMEAKRFVRDDNFDLAPIKGRVKYIVISKEDYDFKAATTKSRMNLTVSLETAVSGDFKASRGNCDHLKHIIRKYFVVNVLAKE